MTDGERQFRDRAGGAERPDVLRDVGRLLCLRLDNAGDVVLTGPALRALRDHLPAARIDLLASPAGARAATLLPWIDEIVEARVSWQDAHGGSPPDRARELALVERIAARRYDAAIIFTSFSQTPWPPAYATYLAGIPVRAGAAREFGGAILSHAVEPAPHRTHEADRDLRLVEALGVPVRDRGLRVAIPADAEMAAEQLLATAGLRPDARPIVVAPGASCTARRWSPARYAAVASALRERTGAPVVVTGGAAEAPLAEPILGAVPDAVSLVGLTDIPALAAIVGRAGLVVTGNSLVMHLAEALDRPVAVLYAGTDREVHWAPRRTRAVVLRQETECAPCWRFDCPYAQACLDIDPADVVAAALPIADLPIRGAAA